MKPQLVKENGVKVRVPPSSTIEFSLGSGTMTFFVTDKGKLMICIDGIEADESIKLLEDAAVKHGLRFRYSKDKL